MSAGKNRTSAAKADYLGTLYGTAEAVPFQDRVLMQTLKPSSFWPSDGTAEVVPFQERVLPQTLKPSSFWPSGGTTEVVP
jgi:hypothetical protein